MEEELNEHDLEERLYAMLHHVDETQNYLTDTYQNKLDVENLVANTRSTVRRYWRTDTDTNPYQKVNAPKDLAPPVTSTTLPSVSDNSKPKVEKNAAPKPSLPVDLSLLQSPIPQNVKKTIEFMDHEEQNPVVLESSDEDEVVEVELPPKPTITIESSDEDEIVIIKPKSPTKADANATSEQKACNGERAVSSSPVPSVVSSVSDEFIRGDCIALNISSRCPDKHSFDFSLHGSDLLLQNTPSKKKKRKKNKEAVTSTPISKSTSATDECFATPKSKAKNKKQRSKLVTEKTIPSPDIYDSDSNHHIIQDEKNENLYTVTEKSLPSTDVYESDSNQSEIVKEVSIDQSNKSIVHGVYSSDSSASNDEHEVTDPKKNNSLNETSIETLDLTNNDNFITIDNIGICESIVMGNVTGFTDSHADENHPLSSKKDISKYVSSKVPSILNEDLDFDNLKGIEKVCKRKRYSLSSLRAEMEKFYNESWGGEDFNHREIQKNMSRDKSLWVIDPKDRMPSLTQRKTRCNYCNRIGHRDDTCRQKPPVCYMCGNTGHYEPRCPSKICVNCGAPNFMYSTMCRNCSSWASVTCAECGQRGHPASHCPDLWRRYHNTIDTDMSLEMCNTSKKHYQQFCSGCSRRGHFVHTCRSSLPFSGLPINSPFVRLYRPLYRPSENQNSNQKQRSKSFSQDSTITSATSRPDRNKRQSRSPTAHESHVNKKRNVSFNDADRQNKSLTTEDNIRPIESTPKNKNKSKSLDCKTLDSSVTAEKPSEVVSTNSNRDNEGHIIQDNEVSDTSAVVTSARIYVTNEVVNKLKTKSGEDWLKATTEKLSVVVENADISSFLSIKGNFTDQEAFQAELREWSQKDSNKEKITNTVTSISEETNNPSGLQNLPKNRHNLLKHLSTALDLLKNDLGDPKALYKELTFSQNKHDKLLKQKVISPKRLSHSRTHINDVLKKLNIILLGQAGLADGAEHINVLYSFKDQLTKSHQKIISPALRKEIGDHYHCIFSSSARDDYMELLKKYYLSKTTTKLAKRKRKKKSKKLMNLNNTELSKKDTIPSEEKNVEVVVSKPNLNNSSEASKDVDTREILRSLISYRKRLNSLHHSVDITKQKRQEIRQISRRFHPFIVILFRKEKVTSKLLKKMRRAQELARRFLMTNV